VHAVVFLLVLSKNLMRKAASYGRRRGWLVCSCVAPSSGRGELRSRSYALQIEQARRHQLQEKRIDEKPVQNANLETQPHAEPAKELSFSVRARSLVESRISGTLNTINLYTQGNHNRAVPLYGSLMPYILDTAGNAVVGIVEGSQHIENIKNYPRTSLVVCNPFAYIRLHNRKY